MIQEHEFLNFMYFWDRIILYQMKISSFSSSMEEKVFSISSLPEFCTIYKTGPFSAQDMCHRVGVFTFLAKVWIRVFWLNVLRIIIVVQQKYLIYRVFYHIRQWFSFFWVQLPLLKYTTNIKWPQFDMN